MRRGRQGSRWMKTEVLPPDGRDQGRARGREGGSGSGAEKPRPQQEGAGCEVSSWVSRARVGVGGSVPGGLFVRLSLAGRSSSGCPVVNDSTLSCLLSFAGWQSTVTNAHQRTQNDRTAVSLVDTPTREERAGDPPQRAPGAGCPDSGP